MQIYRNTPSASWAELLRRPAVDLSDIEAQVQLVIDQVKEGGDTAVLKFTKQFEGLMLDNLQVPHDQITMGETLDESLKTAIIQAKNNITAFHQTQAEPVRIIETMPGVRCWRRSVAIEKVGLYIPSGSAPLFSTVLMLGVPAVLAGCKEIVLCSPAGKDGHIHPATLFAAQLLGITKIFKVGGIQAIAAMAFGTETIPKVLKIFGPGNRFVTMAKQLVARQGVAIDMPAGPSEVLILADSTANADFIAADLIAQAEHGPDSQCILVSTDELLVERVYEAVLRQTIQTSRKEFVDKSLENCRLIYLPDLDQAFNFVNAYAPEHLIIMTAEPQVASLRVINAGSVFLGPLTPVSVGDYASGTNHTLPTDGAAATYSGVSLDSFVKKITFQTLSAEGLLNVGPIVETLAQSEHLTAHSDAVTIRLNFIQNKSEGPI